MDDGRGTGSIRPCARRGWNWWRCAGVNPEKTKARANEYHVADVFHDPVRMCREADLDAVLIVAGPRGHYEVGRSIIPLGKPVWMEKPCAENAGQAEELSDLARKAGSHVQVGFNYRYASGIRKARDMIDSGSFASPAMISVRWWLGESDTGRFMLHYACHAVDLLHSLTPGGLLDHLDPKIEHHRQDDLDWFQVTFRGANGCLAVLEMGAHMPLPGHWARVDLMSRDGLLTVRDFTEVIHHKSAPWGDQVRPGDQPWDGDQHWRTEPLLHHDSIENSWGYVPELIKFREIVEGAAEPETTIHEASWGMQVLKRMQES